jgi:uncharacterized protein
MNTGTTPAHVNQITTWGSSVLRFLRQHPIAGYFLLAFALQWSWMIPLYSRVHQQMITPWVILSPFLAALIMAWITEGKVGVGQLLRRCLRWRVNLVWYALALFCIPLAYVLGISFKSGALAALRPGVTWLIPYGTTVIVLLFGALGEEPGWRGFALPRLQERFGPLVGTLILGSLWVIWHLPVWVFVPGGNAGGNPIGRLAITVSFIGWASFLIANSIIMTWMFNHTRGSALLAIVFHAAINASYATIPGLFFPTLYPAGSTYAIAVGTEIILVLVAVMLIVATQGRLGYDQYRCDTTCATPSSGVKQGQTAARPL